jgi:hypothetical protein
MNVLQLKDAYLKYMGHHAPIWANRKPSKLVDFPSPAHFASNGYANWFTRRLTRDPWSSEAFSHCARCLNTNASTGQSPFFMSLEDVGWNMFNRRKVIKDNFGFLREAGLDPAKVRVSVWKGGTIRGAGLDAARVPEVERLAREGIAVPMDEESVSAWKECGLADSQIVALGESEKIDPEGSTTVHLNGVDSFAGIRSGVYYLIRGRYVEIGENVVDYFVKQLAAVKMQVAAAALADEATSGLALLRLKGNTIAGGFVAERLAMASNDVDSSLDLEPYRELEISLVKRGPVASADIVRVRNAVACIPGIVWLVNDGAGVAEGNTRPRLALYRGLLKTMIENVRRLGFERDDVYLDLFRQTCAFYAQDDDFRSVSGLETACLEEVKKQSRRMK